MCGIFGVIVKEKSKINPEAIKECVNLLFKLSESRGKEAAGLAAKTRDEIIVYKQAIPASEMIGLNDFKKILSDIISNNPYLIIGHSRLVTNGDQSLNINNQPVVKDGVIGVHNGIVTNVNDIWTENPSLNKQSDVDTEIIWSLINNYDPSKKSLIDSVQKTFNKIEGAASIAVFFNDNPYAVLATNTGSLYICENDNFFVFASEKYILKKLTKKLKLDEINESTIKHIAAGNGYLINTEKFEIADFNIFKGNNTTINTSTEKVKITDKSPADNSQNRITPSELNPGVIEYTEVEVKRCSKCILPETFPEIVFDNNGVCNHCNSYIRKDYYGEEALEKAIEPYKKNNGKPDCLVAFSGGRDSSYGLHYIKNVLKMNPIAFTYDWGMVTDLARRNQARICGKLGIEHIIISADIAKKRKNIRRNVEAWLKKPDLGMVPLFMAGDKQFFYYANKLMKQNDIKLLIWCENERLENTKFKTAFCGVNEGNNRWANMPGRQKIKLALYYIKQFIKNPAYINPSLFNTISAYLSTYFLHHDYLFLYRYIKWDEDIINSTLIKNYNWETASDTDSTWRIGDGTAPFYNYIYYTAAGFTEFDTFHSNQIREGLMSREKALELIKKENQPRPEALVWYVNQLGLDINKTIKIINSIPKKYKKS